MASQSVAPCPLTWPRSLFRQPRRMRMTQTLSRRPSTARRFVLCEKVTGIPGLPCSIRSQSRGKLGSLSAPKATSSPSSISRGGEVSQLGNKCGHVPPAPASNAQAARRGDNRAEAVRLGSKRHSEPFESEPDLASIGSGSRGHSVPSLRANTAQDGPFGQVYSIVTGRKASPARCPSHAPSLGANALMTFATYMPMRPRVW